MAGVRYSAWALQEDWKPGLDSVRGVAMGVLMDRLRQDLDVLVESRLCELGEPLDACGHDVSKAPRISRLTSPRPQLSLEMHSTSTALPTARTLVGNMAQWGA